MMLLLFTGIMISSCLKQAENVGPVQSNSLTGKWRIVSDSTIIQFWGLWNARADTGVNYAGKPVDYYNFLASGTLYTFANGVLDTATYKALTNDTIQLKYANPPWENPAKYLVSNYTGHTLTLTSAFPVVSPETAYTHIIKLSK